MNTASPKNLSQTFLGAILTTMSRWRHAVIVLVALLAANPAEAALTYAWTKIVDSNTERPEGGLFTAFDLRGGLLAGSKVFFTDNGSVYQWADGAIACILTNGAVYPQIDPGPLMIDRLTSFRAIGENHLVVCALLTNFARVSVTYRDGQIFRTVGPDVVIEGSTNRPPDTCACTAFEDRLAVQVQYPKPDAEHPSIPVPPHPDGWYLVESNVARYLIGPGDTIPDRGDTIADITELQMGSATSWFFNYRGTVSGVDGFALLETGRVTTILRTGDPLPGTPRSFGHVGNMSVRRSEAAFTARDSSTRGDLYQYADGALTLLVPREAIIPPSSNETIGALGIVAYDGGNMSVDLTGVEGSAGVFLYTGGGLEPVIRIGDQIGTQTVTSASMGHDLDGNSVCVRLVFEDGTHAIYRGEVVFENMVPTTGDYDGDGSADTSFYDADRDTWYVRSKDNRFKTYRFGYGPTVPAPGDFDGDGIADRAVYDPQNGTWYLMQSHAGFAVHQFGYSGALPVQADYDGDGKTDRAVYDANTGWWFVMGSRDGFFTQQFGYGGTTAIPADFDGDGKTDFGAYERDTGWWFIMSRKGIFWKRQFGYTGVTPMIADFDGSGADFVVFDRAIGRWYVLGQNAGFSVRDFGYKGVLPVTADFDGDRRNDIGVYDPKRAIWYLMRSNAGFKAGGI